MLLTKPYSPRKVPCPSLPVPVYTGPEAPLPLPARSYYFCSLFPLISVSLSSPSLLVLYLSLTVIYLLLLPVLYFFLFPSSFTFLSYLFPFLSFSCLPSSPRHCLRRPSPSDEHMIHVFFSAFSFFFSIKPFYPLSIRIIRHSFLLFPLPYSLLCSSVSYLISGFVLSAFPLVSFCFLSPLPLPYSSRAISSSPLLFPSHLLIFLFPSFFLLIHSSLCHSL